MNPLFFRWLLSLSNLGVRDSATMLSPKKQQIGEGRQIFIASLGIASFIGILRLGGFLQPIELRAFDEMMRHRPAEPPDSRLLVVTVTEDDIKAQGNEPRRGSLSDRTLAKLLAKLESYQPRVIGFDIYRDFPVEAQYPELAKYLRESDRFIGVCQASTDPSESAIEPPPEVPQANLGLSDVAIDSGGIVRRHLLAMTPSPASPCTPQYTLSTQVALRFLEAQGISRQVTPDGLLKLGKVVFKPLESHSSGYQGADTWGHQVLLNYRFYRSPEDFAQQVTVTEVLNDQIESNDVKDRVVLIGVTAPSAKDFFPTPYAQTIPGVVVHAQQVSQILSAVLDGRPLINVWPSSIELLWLISWSWIGATLSWRLLVPRWSVLGISLAAASLTGVCYLALFKGLWLPLVPPILTLVGSAVITQIAILFGFELGRGVESNIYAAIKLYRSRNGKAKNYRNINLRRLNLMGAVLTDVNLSGADLNQANLMQADLERANLSEAQALGTDFSEANLTEADLKGANLSRANLSRANLEGANLAEVQALNTDFSSANLTGACIENWGINASTKFINVHCDYIYLEQGFKERKPDSGFFEPGDFEKLIVRSTKTLDLLFRNGIEPQAFDFAFRQLLEKHGEMGISVKSVEDVGNGDRLVRLTIDEQQANKSLLHKEFFQGYKLKQKQLATARKKLAAAREELAVTQGQLEAEKRQSEGLRADLKEIVSMLATRPMNVSVNVPEVKAIAERQSLASKLVILTLGHGDFEGGFPSVTAQIWTEDNRLPTQCLGQLPPAPEIPELYDRWQSSYKGLKLLPRLEPQQNQVTNFSKEDIYTLAEELEEQINKWLNSESFRPIDKILREKFMRSDEVQVIIQSENIEVRRLPWHLWDFFKAYRKAEVALTTQFYDRLEKPSSPRTEIRILAILGNSTGINLEEDRKVLGSLQEAETVFMVEPTRQEFDKQLWDKQGWDILCFSGHSSSQWDGENGWIYINKTDRLTIAELENALLTAIEQNLQLAIFNSCDGLGLARQLASLHIPQIIVMREPVPDRVAQEFLKNFLTALGSGKSFHMAVRQSREMLQGLENEFPCATWLPVICQNPAEVPMAWQKKNG